MNTPSPPDFPPAAPSHAPRLTDRPALLRQRARAARTGSDDAGPDATGPDETGPDDWLHRIALDEVQDRLADINRTFTDIAVVTGMPGPWRAAFPAARILPDDPVLDLVPGTLDLVVHALALHWADDPVGQIVQCARALRPDGLFIAILPGGQTLAPLRHALAVAETEITGGASPRVLPFGEIRDLGALLGRAGLALPVADQMTQHVSYRDLFHLASDLRAMGEGNALALRSRAPTRRAVFLRAAEILAEAAADPQEPGRIRVGFDLVALTGWAPSENQQKPLRPGSAQMSLSAALDPDRRTPDN